MSEQNVDLQLLETLLEKTRMGRIRWEESASENTYVASLLGADIAVISKAEVLNKDVDLVEELVVLKIETASNEVLISQTSRLGDTSLAARVTTENLFHAVEQSVHQGKFEKKWALLSSLNKL